MYDIKCWFVIEIVGLKHVNHSYSYRNVVFVPKIMMMKLVFNTETVKWGSSSTFNNDVSATYISVRMELIEITENDSHHGFTLY